MSDGVKADAGKPRWSLLPWRALRPVVAVLEHGAQKYSPDNWKRVPDAEQRYKDALLRHVAAWLCGEWRDEESGQPHLAHAACCILFLLWFDETDRRVDWTCPTGKAP